MSEQGLLSEDESWKVYKESGGRGIPPRTQVNSVAKAQIAELKGLGYVKWDREKVARKLWYFRTGAVMSKDDHPSPELLSQADQLKEILTE